MSTTSAVYHMKFFGLLGNGRRGNQFFVANRGGVAKQSGEGIKDLLEKGAVNYLEKMAGRPLGWRGAIYLKRYEQLNMESNGGGGKAVFGVKYDMKNGINQGTANAIREASDYLLREMGVSLRKAGATDMEIEEINKRTETGKKLLWENGAFNLLFSISWQK